MTTAAFAQQTQTPANAPAVTPAQTAAADESSPLTLDASVKYVTAYFSRGYNYGDSGLILQPEATVAYTYEASEDLTITPWFNVWNSITDQHYADGDYWDEVDLTPGVDFTMGRFTLSLQYIYYNSPVNNWGDVEEVGAVLSFDDSELTECPIAFNPYVGYYREINNEDIDNRQYAEVGIKPKWSPEEDSPLTLTFPIALGMNIDGWYADEDGDQTLLGYGSAGAVATYYLTDNVYLTAGLKYIYLIADNVRDINDGDQNVFVGSLGVGVSF